MSVEYFDQLLGAVRQVHVVHLAQLLGAVPLIHFISNHDRLLSFLSLNEDAKVLEKKILYRLLSLTKQI